MKNCITKSVVFKLFILLANIIMVACSTSPEPAPTASSASYTNFTYNIRLEGNTSQLTGIPYEITDRNCDSERDSLKTEERSQTFIINLDIQISAIVATEFGGDIAIAKAEIATQIGTSLGVRIGSQTEARSSLQITTSPGTETSTMLQWKENWVKGNIDIIRPDGTYVAALPFQVLNSLSLDKLESKTINCETETIITEQTIPEAVPSVIPQLTPIPTPAYIGQIIVPGNISTGISFQAPLAGTYIFEYVRGAYSVYADGLAPTNLDPWLTAIRIFKNQPVQWESDGRTISELPEARAFDFKYHPSAATAESKAIGSKIRLNLLQGDELVLVAVDHREAYGDNPGEVTMDVFLIPEP